MSIKAQHRIQATGILTQPSFGRNIGGVEKGSQCARLARVFGLAVGLAKLS
jgi:hypothetical protein